MNHQKLVILCNHKFHFTIYIYVIRLFSETNEIDSKIFRSVHIIIVEGFYLIKNIK